MSGGWQVSITGNGDAVRVSVRLPDGDMTVAELRAFAAHLADVLAVAEGQGPEAEIVR